MRLIDADELMVKEYSQLRDGDVLWRIPPSHIDLAPTIDAVPMVRCRECENESLSTDHEGGASYSLNFYDDDFCSYGERREADHDKHSSNSL